MDLALKDQLAVVVGAAQGIGRAIAEQFAEAGARLALVDIAPQVEAVASDIHTKLQVAARSWTADASSFHALSQVAHEVSQMGDVDHVVYAAGTGSGKYGFPFWNLMPADWERVWQVTMMGAVHTAHAFAPEMAARGRGTLLFLSSIAGQIGSQTDPPYSAAKAALINFAQCAARDLAPYNVRVNCLAPGMVKTGLNRAVWQAWRDQNPAVHTLAYEEWAEEKIRRVTPLGRWQEAEDMAAMAVFLASTRAKNITGQTINIDGGWLMR